MPKFYPPVLQNVTLFGNRAVADVISEGEVIHEDGGAIVHYDRCLYVKRTDAQGECQGTAEAERRARRLQARDRWLPQRPGRHTNGLSLGSQRKRGLQYLDFRLAAP